MTATSTISAAVNDTRADLDQIRDLVQDLLAERASVEAAPCDREEAKRRVDRLIEGASASGIFDRHEIFAPEQTAISPYFARTLADNLLGVLATLAPDQLRDTLMQHHPGGGLGPDARAAKLLDLDRRLEAACVAEEVTARELERAVGAAVPRRLEAPVDVLLAPDEELEPPDLDPDTAPADAGSTRRM